MDEHNPGNFDPIFRTVGLFGDEDSLTTHRNPIETHNRNGCHNHGPDRRAESCGGVDGTDESGEDGHVIDPSLIDFVRDAAKMPWGVPLSQNTVRSSVCAGPDP